MWTSGLCFLWHWTVDSDLEQCTPPPPCPITYCHRTAMLSPGAVLFFTLILMASSLGQRTRKPYGSTSPISTIQAQANFNAQQFAGTWLLVAVGSACRFLQEQGHRAEATTLHIAPQGAAMAASTFRKLDGICWQVRQLYGITGVPGRFLLQARTLPVSDSALNAFEERVRGANLTEDQIFFFPKYGFCETADQFHILNDNTYKREHRPLLHSFITLFKLRDNSEFQVTNSMTRGKHCSTWSYTLIPTNKPGQFTRDNRGSGPGADKENIQVIETDYVKFALVLSLRQASNQNITRVSLLGRDWKITHKTIDRFICLTKTQNLTKNNLLFPDLTGNGFVCRG
uniref:Complement C8 gamma chain n=1 Tax=Rattus norvegicus TaxID=10116 RepID=A0ABK0LUP9_RAT